MRCFRFILTICAAMMSAAMVSAQTPDSAVKWRVNVKMISPDSGEVIIKAIPDDGWHIYGTSMPKGGPVPTVIDLKESTGVSFTSPVKVYPAPSKGIDPMFNLELSWWESPVTFRREFKVTDAASAKIQGSVSYMVCNQRNCMRPPVYNFSKPLPKSK